MKRKYLFFLIAAAMILTIAPTISFAAADTVEVSRGMSFTKDTTDADINEWAEGAATIEANDDGTYTVTLKKNISITSAVTPITFGVYNDGPDQSMIILDLNGYTVSSVTTVLCNYGNLTIKDSVGTGKVVYTGGKYLCAVQCAGYDTIINAGTFECQGAGSATYNAAVNVTYGMSNLIVNGGTFEGNNAGAIIAYGKVTINGGEIYGAYGVVSKTNTSQNGAGQITFPTDSTAVINADKIAFVIHAAGELQGQIYAQGGTFNAPAVAGSLGNADPQTAISATGGVYSADPTSFVKNNETVAQFTAQSSTFYTIGKEAVETKAAACVEGDKVAVLAGDASLNVAADGVEISNAGSGTVSVNKQPVTADTPIVTHTHVWGTPEWTWTDDCSSAQATFKCEKDNNHTTTVEAAVIKQTTESTCTEDGRTVYTATAEFEGESYTDNKETIIAATGHSYAEEYKYNGTEHWKECKVCGNKIDTGSHTLVWITDKEATQTQAGSRHEECEICGYKKAAEEIPPTGQTEDPNGSQPPTDGDSESPSTADGRLVLSAAVTCITAAGLCATMLVIKKKKYSK